MDHFIVVSIRLVVSAFVLFSCWCAIPCNKFEEQNERQTKTESNHRQEQIQLGLGFE